MAKKLISDTERFFRNTIRAENGCLEWQLTLDKDGYGHFRTGSYTDGTRKNTRAHRWSYEEFIGPIPDGLVIDHECTNPCCVDPNHLQAVTHLRNTQLGWERGTHKSHPVVHSEETKEKIRQKHLGLKASAETRALMSASQKKRQDRRRLLLD